MSKFISGVLAVSFATALSALSLVGCDAQAPDDDAEETAPVALEVQGGSGPSCDDFDTYCSPARPCAKGYVCSYAGGCGQNFFGTYPYCGVTDTCYPTCTESE